MRPPGSTELFRTTPAKIGAKNDPYTLLADVWTPQAIDEIWTNSETTLPSAIMSPNGDSSQFCWLACAIGRVGNVVHCRIFDGQWEDRQRRGVVVDVLGSSSCFRKPRPPVNPALAIRVAAVECVASIFSESRLPSEGKREVWTLSTLCPPDWAVHRPDCPGLPMFSRVPSVYKARNPVRVPPRARVFPAQGLVGR